MAAPWVKLIPDVADVVVDVIRCEVCSTQIVQVKNAAEASGPKRKEGRMRHVKARECSSIDGAEERDGIKR